jgi:hypothetical protein
MGVECISRDHRPGQVQVGQQWLEADHLGQGLGVQAGQRVTDGGLGGHDAVGGPITAGAKRHPDQLRGICGPLGDRGHRSCAAQHRRGGHGQDRDQRVASATATSRVADRGEVGQQVRRFGLLEGVGVGELGEGGWNRG